jgi:sugar lactone lactonase YvrE
METLVNGYGLVEAPRVDGEGNLFFTDVFDGGVYRRSPDGEVETVVPKRRGVGGLALHREGGVVVSGRTVVHCRAGETRTLLEVDGVTGFNDLTTDAEGGVIVGALRFNPFQGEDPVPGEIWRIDPGGESSVLCEGVGWPNGIGLAPGGGTLYVNDYGTGTVSAYDLQSTPPHAGRVFARSPAGADGLAVDEQGGVWIALGDGGGLARFGADGALDTTIDVPASFVSSLSFGGADRRDLYVTTADPGCVFRTRSDVAGLPTEPAAV